MGLLDSIIGGTSNSTTSQNQNTKTTGTQTSEQTTEQTRTQNQQSTGSGVSNTQQLDQDTIDLLQSVLGSYAGREQTGQTEQQAGSLDRLTSVLDTLSNRAAGAMDNLDSTVAAQQDKARQEFDLTTAAQIAQTQQQTGSRYGNSFSQLLEQQGNRQLNTDLAKIASDATLQARAQQSADYNTVAQLATALPSLVSSSESSGAANVANIANILKGANTTTETSTEQQTALSDLLEAIVKGNVVTDQTSKTTGSARTESEGGILGWLF